MISRYVQEIQLPPMSAWTTLLHLLSAPLCINLKQFFLDK